MADWIFGALFNAKSDTSLDTIGSRTSPPHEAIMKTSANELDRCLKNFHGELDKKTKSLYKKIHRDEPQSWSKITAKLTDIRALAENVGQTLDKESAWIRRLVPQVKIYLDLVRLKSDLDREAEMAMERWKSVATDTHDAIGLTEENLKNMKVYKGYWTNLQGLRKQLSQLGGDRMNGVHGESTSCTSRGQTNVSASDSIKHVEQMLLDHHDHILPLAKEKLDQLEKAFRNKDGDRGVKLNSLHSLLKEQRARNHEWKEASKLPIILDPPVTLKTSGTQTPQALPLSLSHLSKPTRSVSTQTTINPQRERDSQTYADVSHYSTQTDNATNDDETQTLRELALDAQSDHGSQTDARNHENRYSQTELFFDNFSIGCVERESDTKSIDTSTGLEVILVPTTLEKENRVEPECQTSLPSQSDVTVYKDSLSADTCDITDRSLISPATRIEVREYLDFPLSFDETEGRTVRTNESDIEDLKTTTQEDSIIERTDSIQLQETRPLYANALPHEPESLEDLEVRSYLEDTQYFLDCSSSQGADSLENNMDNSKVKNAQTKPLKTSPHTNGTVKHECAGKVIVKPVRQFKTSPATSSGKLSAGSVSGKTSPGSATSGKTSPGSGTSGKTSPGSGTSGKTSPGSGTSGKTSPGSGTSGKTSPGSATSGKTSPGSATSGKPTLGGGIKPSPGGRVSPGKVANGTVASRAKEFDKARRNSGSSPTKIGTEMLRRSSKGQDSKIGPNNKTDEPDGENQKGKLPAATMVKASKEPTQSEIVKSDDGNAASQERQSPADADPEDEVPKPGSVFSIINKFEKQKPKEGSNTKGTAAPIKPTGIKGPSKSIRPESEPMKKLQTQPKTNPEPIKEESQESSKPMENVVKQTAMAKSPASNKGNTDDQIKAIPSQGTKIKSQEPTREETCALAESKSQDQHNKATRDPSLSKPETVKETISTSTFTLQPTSKEPPLESELQQNIVQPMVPQSPSGRSEERTRQPTFPVRGQPQERSVINHQQQPAAVTSLPSPSPEQKSPQTTTPKTGDQSELSTTTLKGTEDVPNTEEAFKRTSPSIPTTTRHETETTQSSIIVKGDDLPTPKVHEMNGVDVTHPQEARTESPTTNDNVADDKKTQSEPPAYFSPRLRNLLQKGAIRTEGKSISYTPKNSGDVNDAAETNRSGPGKADSLTTAQIVEVQKSIPVSEPLKIEIDDATKDREQKDPDDSSQKYSSRLRSLMCRRPIHPTPPSSESSGSPQRSPMSHASPSAEPPSPSRSAMRAALDQLSPKSSFSILDDDILPRRHTQSKPEVRRAVQEDTGNISDHSDDTINGDARSQTSQFSILDDDIFTSAPQDDEVDKENEIPAWRKRFGSASILPNKHRVSQQPSVLSQQQYMDIKFEDTSYARELDLFGTKRRVPASKIFSAPTSPVRSVCTDWDVQDDDLDDVASIYSCMPSVGGSSAGTVTRKRQSSAFSRRRRSMVELPDRDEMSGGREMRQRFGFRPTMSARRSLRPKFNAVPEDQAVSSNEVSTKPNTRLQRSNSLRTMNMTRLNQKQEVEEEEQSVQITPENLNAFQEKYNIRHVFDSLGMKMTVEEAIRRGIIDLSTGTYVNPFLNKSFSIETAMARGLATTLSPEERLAMVRNRSSAALDAYRATRMNNSGRKMNGEATFKAQVPKPEPEPEPTDVPDSSSRYSNEFDSFSQRMAQKRQERLEQSRPQISARATARANERLQRRNSGTGTGSTYGMICFNVDRVPDPYYIVSAIDTTTNVSHNYETARRFGILEQNGSIFVNKRTRSRMPIFHAVDQNLVTVAPNTRASCEPEGMIVDHFLVYGVMDVRNQKRVTFREAVNLQILKPGLETFTNTSNNQEMTIDEGIENGFIVAKKITAESLNLYDGMVSDANRISCRREQRFSKHVPQKESFSVHTMSARSAVGRGIDLDLD